MKIGNTKIETKKGDITKCEVDAIVNAANSSLMGGGGVDGAIHRAGGPEILRECKQIVDKQGPCPAGEAVITGAGNLPAKYVIHTVGPVWKGGNNNEREILKNAYINSLQLAEQYELTSVAFPNISTGVYGYPKELAVQDVKAAIENYFNGSSKIENVLFVCFDDENFDLYKNLFHNSFL